MVLGGFVWSSLTLSLCWPRASRTAKSGRRRYAPYGRWLLRREKGAETVVLTGHIQADDEPAFAFRLGGRMIERPVNVGDRVKARQLLANGHTPRARFDQAQKSLQNAQSQVDDAEARLEIATDRVSWTTLTADAKGTVTARGAEPGEVVQAGQMIVRLARQGGRDAVFDVPAQLLRSAPNDSEIT